MGGHDHLVARADSVRTQSQPESRGSGRHPDAVLNARVIRERILELLKLTPQRERTRAEHPSEGLVQLVLELAVLAIESDESDALMRDRCFHQEMPLLSSLGAECMTARRTRRNRAPCPCSVQ